LKVNATKNKNICTNDTNKTFGAANADKVDDSKSSEFKITSPHQWRIKR
jgi:hypothetical protein